MKHMPLEELREFYIDHLFNTLISFWMRFGVDEENGGFFTCFNNTGDVLKSKHKYIWSQGRFLWMLSRLVYAFHGYTDEKNLAEIRKAAAEGARATVITPTCHCPRITWPWSAMWRSRRNCTCSGATSKGGKCNVKDNRH